MNIYNTLYIIEYSKDPIQYDKCKYWYSNLSKNYYWYNHGNFDLPSVIHKHSKKWHQYNKRHRLIGPADIVDNHNKFYYIRLLT